MTVLDVLVAARGLIEAHCQSAVPVRQPITRQDVPRQATTQVVM
jgi:hypothetical protein